MNTIAELIVGYKPYVISGSIIIVLVTASFISESLWKGLKKILFVGVLCWVSCLAYKVNTGHDISYMIKKIEQGDSVSSGKAGAFQKYVSHAMRNKIPEE